MSAWSCVVETRETLSRNRKSVLRRPYPIDLDAMLKTAHWKAEVCAYTDSFKKRKMRCP